jgi:thiol-disulfide isomerase/thioredoxin
MEATHEPNKKPVGSWPVLVVIAALTGVLVWAFKGRSPEYPENIYPEISAELEAKLSLPADSDAQQPEISHNHAGPSLLDIVKHRRNWNPRWTDSYGKAAPDFEFIDVDGKTIKLSDHNGKNVLLMFWATWCGPCLIEIPHLIELRKNFSKDELAILAVSSENPDTVKRFAENRQINYTVGTLQSSLPRPFADVRSIPSAFYIDKQGRIKLGTEGFVSLAESTAIIKATR